VSPPILHEDTVACSICGVPTQTDEALVCDSCGGDICRGCLAEARSPDDLLCYVCVRVGSRGAW